MEKIHEHVPVLAQKIDKSHSAGTTTIEEARFHQILLGGDQLTVARGRSAQSIRQNAGSPILHLEGLETIPLDWHTKMNFLEVSNIIYFFDVLLYYFLYYF